MVDVANRAYVDVRLLAFEFGFGHEAIPRKMSKNSVRYSGSAWWRTTDFPRESAGCQRIGAHDRNRTDDLTLTKGVLYHLSYMGKFASA